MAIDFDGSNSRIAYNIAASAVTVGTMAGWVNADTLPGATERDQIVTFYVSGAGEPFNVFDKRLFVRSTGIVVGHVFDGGQKQAVSTTAITTGTWFHIALGFSNANDLRIFINGALEATTAMSADSFNFTDEAVFFCGLPNSATDGETSRARFDGKMAEWGIWNAELDAAQIAALAKGYAPSHFRRNLVLYVPMVRSENEALGAPITGSVGLTAADHPRIIYPRPPRNGRLTTAAAGGGFQAAWARNANTLLQAGIR